MTNPSIDIAPISKRSHGPPIIFTFGRFMFIRFMHAPTRINSLQLLFLFTIYFTPTRQRKGREINYRLVLNVTRPYTHTSYPHH